MATNNNMTLVMDPNDYRVVQEKLTKLGSIVSQGIVQEGLREGARVLVKQGKENIQKHNLIKTGGLLKSAGVLTRKKTGKAYAGFNRGKGYHGAIAHILDRGTQIRKTKNGANRGRITPTHFWEDAVNAKSKEAMQTVYEAIEKSIDRIINGN
jgi:hypothetical protein